MGSIRVTDPGVLSIVQDLGRQGMSAVGIPAGGAADPISLRVGNRLVGNPDNAAALEMTLSGGTFVFDNDAVVVFAGADATPSLERVGKQPHSLHTWMVTPVRAGEKLRTGRFGRGARLYLCVSGGLNVPPVLGGASTLLGPGFGGFDGRPLRPDDVLEFHDQETQPASLSESAHAFVNEILDQRTLRAVPGGHTGDFDAPAQATFWSSSYTVTTQSNRVGLSLEGPPITARPGPRADGRMVSEGMPPGAVQVPPGGRPIILMADHPTTGGYPAIACIATADLPVLGQLRPHNLIKFQRVSQDEALALFRERERRLNEEVSPP